MFGPVILSVPADANYAKVVRLTALAVAVDVGFDVEDLQDLTFAVDRVFTAATVAVHDPTTQVELELFRTDDSLVIDGRVDGRGANPVQVDEVTHALLALALDACDLGRAGSEVFRLMKTSKRRM